VTDGCSVQLVSWRPPQTTPAKTSSFPEVLPDRVNPRRLIATSRSNARTFRVPISTLAGDLGRICRASGRPADSRRLGQGFPASSS
jgi:hypothetical protein